MLSKIFIAFSFLITLFFADPAWAQLDKTYTAYQDKNGLWGFQEIKLDFSYGGKTKTPVRIKAQFDAVAKDWFWDICAVKKGGKWGYVNPKGNMVIPFQYEEANGKFVKMNGKWGTIDKNGVPAIPCTFVELKSGGALNIASENGTLYGYVDDAGKTVVPFIYEECYPFDGSSNIVKTATGYEMKSSNALAKVKLNGRYGLIDVNNKYVLYPKFRDIWNFFGAGQYIWISLNGTDYGVADRNGKILMPTYFRNMGTFDGNGEAKASSPRYNENGRLSTGIVSAVKQTYRDGRSTHTFDNVHQNYLTKKDSVTFGLLKESQNDYLAGLINIYQNKPNGYIANKIATRYLTDSLNQASVQQAMTWLQKGSESDHDPLCSIYLSTILIGGDFKVPKDAAKGVLLLDRTMSDIFKNPSLLKKYDEFALDMDEADEIVDILTNGFYMVGNCYLTGIGTEKSEKQAISWYEKGAEFDNPYCTLTLGDIYYKGDQTMAKDPVKALHYYEMAADAGVADAMYIAATMYLDGIGTSKNREKAIPLLKKASSLTHKAAKELLVKLGEG